MRQLRRPLTERLSNQLKSVPGVCLASVVLVLGKVARPPRLDPVKAHMKRVVASKALMPKAALNLVLWILDSHGLRNSLRPMDHLRLSSTFGQRPGLWTSTGTPRLARSP